MEESDRAREGLAPRESAPVQTPLSRTEIVVLIQEIERIQARFARRNNTGWAHACDTLLGNCRKLLGDGEG